MQPVLGIGQEGSVKEEEKGEEYLCAVHVSCFLCSLKIDLDLTNLVGVCESSLDRNLDIRSNLEYI